MSNFHILQYGQIDEVLTELEAKRGEMDTAELRAALSNIARQVLVLQRQQRDGVARMRSALQGVLDPFHEGQITVRPEAVGYVQAAVNAGEEALAASGGDVPMKGE